MSTCGSYDSARVLRLQGLLASAVSEEAESRVEGMAVWCTASPSPAASRVWQSAELPRPSRPWRLAGPMSGLDQINSDPVEITGQAHLERASSQQVRRQRTTLRRSEFRTLLRGQRSRRA